LLSGSWGHNGVLELADMSLVAGPAGAAVKISYDVRNSRNERIASGTRVFTLEGPTAAAAFTGMLTSAPQPFKSTTALTYSGTEIGQMVYRIYNAQGQVLASRVAFKADAAAYHFTWDGLDDKGQVVAPGAYLCRMSIGAKTYDQLLIKAE
jgi:hypothetical protein